MILRKKGVSIKGVSLILSLADGYIFQSYFPL